MIQQTVGEQEDSSSEINDELTNEPPITKPKRSSSQLRIQEAISIAEHFKEPNGKITRQNDKCKPRTKWSIDAAENSAAICDGNPVMDESRPTNGRIPVETQQEIPYFNENLKS